MESQQCVPRSRDAHKAILSAAKCDGQSSATPDSLTRAYRKVSQHGDEGQEHKEEHGEEASSENAEGEAAGKERQEVAERAKVGDCKIRVNVRLQPASAQEAGHRQAVPRERLKSAPLSDAKSG